MCLTSLCCVVKMREQRERHQAPKERKKSKSALVVEVETCKM